MPLPLLAHQAPVLPLKLWRPTMFNGTALVLGSIAPDLEYMPLVVAPQAAKGFAHTVAGQLLFCLPVALLGVWLIGRLDLGDVLAARLPSRFAWISGAATDVVRPGGWGRAAMSVLVGSFSHIALDALTHTVLPAGLPAGLWRMGSLRFSPIGVVQLFVSVSGALVTLWLLHAISRRRSVTVPARRPGAFLVEAFACAGAALGVLGAGPAIRNPDAYFEAGGLYVWGFVAFFVAFGSGIGVLVAGVTLALRDRRRTPA